MNITGTRESKELKLGVGFELVQVIETTSKSARGVIGVQFCYIPGYENYFAVVGGVSPYPYSTSLYRVVNEDVNCINSNILNTVELVQTFLDKDIGEVSIIYSIIIIYYQYSILFNEYTIYTVVLLYLLLDTYSC